VLVCRPRALDWGRVGRDCRKWQVWLRGHRAFDRAGRASEALGVAGESER
jgi:hypothetical protein